MLWIACTVLVLLAAWYVLRPLWGEAEGAWGMELSTEDAADRLRSRKAAVYGNLKDLEFEYQMGRLTESDYVQLQANYKNEAAGILQRLDQLQAAENLDAAIEKDIALRKARLYGGAGKNARDAQDGSRCSACGAKTIPGKKFCADCGARL